MHYNLQWESTMAVFLGIFIGGWIEGSGCGCKDSTVALAF